MDALKEIEAAWMEWSGYDTAPPGGGPALEKWEVFKAAWAASKSLAEKVADARVLEQMNAVSAMRSELEYLNKTLLETRVARDSCIDERDEARRLSDALVESGDPKPWKINDWHAAKEKCAAWKIGDWGFKLGEEYPK